MTDKNQALDIDQVARLSRIELTDDEKTKLKEKLSSIFGYFEQLNSVDVSNIEPTAHAFDLFNVWEQDEPGPTFTPKQALSNTPKQKDNQIIVPKVVE